MHLLSPIMNRSEYLITCAMEECAEVTHILSKIQRFGIGDMHPNGGLDNSKLLVQEINDLMAVLWMLKQEGILPAGALNKTAMRNKIKRVERYMEYSRKVGTLKQDFNTE